MVAHFANKNTISLGLGCTGSGMLVLLVELVLDSLTPGELSYKPKYLQLVILFELGAGGGPGLAACRVSRQSLAILPVQSPFLASSSLFDAAWACVFGMRPVLHVPPSLAAASAIVVALVLTVVVIVAAIQQASQVLWLQGS